MPEDDGFPPDEEQHQGHAGNQPTYIRFPDGIHHGAQILPVEDAVEGKPEDQG